MLFFADKFYKPEAKFCVPSAKFLKGFANQNPKPDLNSAYFNLDSGLENHRVQTTLNNFTRQKEQAKTLPEILQITAGRQEFLSSLHNTIKYPELQSQDLLDSISNAHKGQQDNIMQELYNERHI